MELKTKQRVIGGLVLAGVVLLILPFLFHDQQPTSSLKLTVENSKITDTSDISLSIPDQQKNAGAQNTAENHTISTPSATSILPAASAKNIVSTDSSKSKTENKKSTHAIVTTPHKIIDAKKSVAHKQIAIPFWVIQVGVFSNESNTKQFIKKLQARGFKPYAHRLSNAKNKSLTAVFVGRETNYKKILILQKKINHYLHINGIIKKG